MSCNGEAESADLFTSSAMVSQYSIREDAWDQQNFTYLVTARYSASACSLGSRVYAFCGRAGTGQLLNSVEQFDYANVVSGWS